MLKLSIGYGVHGWTDGRTDGRTDTEGYNIIPRHTLVAGYKKAKQNWITEITMALINEFQHEKNCLGVFDHASLKPTCSVTEIS